MGGIDPEPDFHRHSQKDKTGRGFLNIGPGRRKESVFILGSEAFPDPDRGILQVMV